MRWGRMSRCSVMKGARWRLLETLKEGAKRTEQEIFWLHRLGWTLAPIRGWQDEEVAAAFSRLGELSRQTGNSRELMRALSALKQYHLNRYELLGARAVAEEHLAIAGRAGDPIQQASAHAGLGDVLIELGEFAEARENIEKAGSLLSAPAGTDDCGGYTPLQLRGLWGYSAYRAPEILWFLGFPDRARRRSEEALSSGARGRAADPCPRPDLYCSYACQLQRV